MDSVLELQRQTHEEIELAERALYTLLARPNPTHEARLQNEHKSAQVLDRISTRVTTLNALYEDEATRKAEIDSLANARPPPNDLAEFYGRLAKIHEHYSKYPDAVAVGFDMEIAALLDEPDQDDDEYDDEDRTYRLLPLSPPF